MLFYGRTVPVTAANLKERSETLLEQYGKTGSLFPHNVVLVPLGDDFTYDHENEWDQQYSNYKMIMDYINQVRILSGGCWFWCSVGERELLFYT